MFLLNDNNLVTWQVSCSSLGALKITAVAHQSTAAVYINAGAPWQVFSLGITSGSTTAGSAISSGSQTVTPASMAGIAVAVPIQVDYGTGSWETIVPTAVTATTFTATFSNTHSASHPTLIVGGSIQTTASAIGPGSSTLPLSFGYSLFVTSAGALYISAGLPLGIALPMIVYPSTPPVFPLPLLSQTSGGSFGSRTLFVKVTPQTSAGEGLPSAEASITVSSNHLLVVTAPLNVPCANGLTGWNVYVGGSSGAEGKQGFAVLAFGANWTEPATGYTAGAAPPSSWGTVLYLTGGPPSPFEPAPWNVSPYPLLYDELPRKATLTGSDFEEFLAVTKAFGGPIQAVLFRQEAYLEFEIPRIRNGQPLSDWSAFMRSAVQYSAFDYFPDRNVNAFTTYFLETGTKAWKAPYLSAGYAGPWSNKFWQAIV